MASTKTNVKAIPNCQLCDEKGINVPAYADAKIPYAGWAYLCKAHFNFHGCSLGVGKGQELVLEEKKTNKPKPVTVSDLLAVIKETDGSFEEMIDEIENSDGDIF